MIWAHKKTLRASRIRQQTLKVFAFKTILKGSSFCTFGRVMYKTKTPVKFVDNCKSLCSLFMLRSRNMCEPFGSDFKTILKGSSFCTFGKGMYKTKTPVKLVDNRKS